MIDETITRDEIETATEVMCEYYDEIVDLDPITKDTVLLNMMLSCIGSVDTAVAIRAAFHHGIRLGLQIAVQRTAGVGSVQ